MIAAGLFQNDHQLLAKITFQKFKLFLKKNKNKFNFFLFFYLYNYGIFLFA